MICKRATLFLHQGPTYEYLGPTCEILGRVCVDQGLSSALLFPYDDVLGIKVRVISWNASYIMNVIYKSLTGECFIHRISEGKW